VGLEKSLSPLLAGFVLNNKNGFTLIEILVAVTLFLLATVSFTFVLQSAKTSANTTEVKQQAIYAVQATYEQLKLVPFNQLKNFDGLTFWQKQGKIEVKNLLADLLTVKIELAWHPQKNPIKLHSLRSKY